MEDSEYVTVVSVDNGAENIKTDSHSNSQQMNFELDRESQFVTIVSINDDINSKKPHKSEEVIVYRLPGERLGFGLKFQGGSKSTENIQRLFIQSCANDTPASRAKTSWGFLCEGDEILEIDGIDVKTMTRLECVRYLKESNLAIKLNVRNIRDMENEAKEFIEIKEKSHILPPTPSAPPRKINKRKPLKIDHEIKDVIHEKPLTPPPDAEYYVNLFSDENENLKFRDYESDDTASTISTVVDNFSIHSNSDLSLSSFNAKQPEITKALKSFTTLEKEFNVDNRSKSDDPIFKPPAVFQDDCSNKQTTSKKDIQFQSIEIKKDSTRTDDDAMVKVSDYENIDLASKATKRNYENIEFNRTVTYPTPTPLPRRGIMENNKIIIPKVRLIGSDDVDGVHECNINTDDSSKEDDKENELPKLIKCVPKMSLADKFKLNISENEKIAAVVKQCIKIEKTSHEVCSSSDDDDVESTNNLMSDDDSDKLGPPELVDGPGPSEVYFNYHWNNNALPTIGEVEEEFSSLDMNKGPIVIINKVEEPVTANAESTSINQTITVPPKQLQMTSTKNSQPNDKSTGGKPTSTTSENIKPKLLAKSELSVEVHDLVSGIKSPHHKDKVQSKTTSTPVKTTSTHKLKANELVETQSGSQQTDSIKNNSKIPIKFNSNNNHKSVITVEKSNKINSNLTSVNHNETLSERNGSTPNIVIVKNVKENLNCRNSQRNSEPNKCELIEPSVSEPKLNCNITSGTVIIAERIILGTESLSAKQTAIGHHQTKMDKTKNEIKMGGMDRDNLTTSKPMIANDIHVSPPTFSRLPPDGHEFPPNFSEPIIVTSVFKQNADIKLGGERSSSSDVAPSPPKSNPPQTLPRKIYRQDLVITVDDSRFDQTPNFIPIGATKNGRSNGVDDKPTVKSVKVATDVTPKEIFHTGKNNFTEPSKTKNDDTPVRTAITARKQYSAITPSNWRKDEKSEKSVRDKIAMFSNDKIKPADRKVLNKSTENLLSDLGDRLQKHNEVEILTLTKKAQSVDTLDTIDSSSDNHFQANFIESTCDNNSSSKKFESAPPSNVYPYHLRAYSVENLRDVDSTSFKQAPVTTNRTTATINPQTPIIPTSYASLPRSKPPTITRTTSFSGSREHQNYDERRRTSISNLLEQRKKSMSKLRGLIIPEKTALTNETEQILDLPEIKSAETQKVTLMHSMQPNSYSRREPVVPNPRHYTASYQTLSSSQENGYVSIFGSGTNRTVPRNGRSSETKTVFPKPTAVTTPPTKPPRTSLIIASQQTTTRESNKYDDSDNDSVFCSKSSSPPHSPLTNPPSEKVALTRTLSSETNTSIASSTTSTLTSGSGCSSIAASCSSVGSTPTIDMSRKIVRSASKDSYVNRKSILALSKCRSGKDDSNGRQHQRYEDEDSTDGCEDDIVRHVPKSKQRSTQFSHNKVVPENVDAITNYRLVSNENPVVDMIVKVAEFIEVTSDSNSDSNTCDSSPAQVIDKFMNEERKASFKAVQEAKIVKTVPKVIVPTAQSKQPENNNDLAKWVRSEVAKTRKVVETQSKPEPPKVPTRNSVLENIKKFNSSVDKPISFTPAPLNIVKKTPPAIESRKSNEMNKLPPPLKSPKGKFNSHERFSSLDSLASSSSGVSSTQTMLTNTPEHGSFSSFESNHSLITPADLQLIIEEADPPLKTPEAVVVVLYRESPECSVGVTLAGGADYETKEITIHRILANSPAYKDGRLRKGDRILSINGLSMRGLTHRESVTVLKSPRTEVVMVVTRSESVKIPNDLGSSLGSLNSLCDKSYSHLDGNRRRAYHKLSKSLDLDVDGVSNEGSIFDDCKSLDDRESTVSVDTSLYGTMDRCAKNNGIHNDDSVKIVEVMKDSCGLGLAIEGGLDSPTGHKPLTVKKVFMGGAAEKAGNINVGDVILSINDFCTKDITRVQAWNYMKGLPSGPVKFVLR